MQSETERIGKMGGHVGQWGKFALTMKVSILKQRKLYLVLVTAIFLIIPKLWQHAIAQDAPQISPFELSRYRAGGSVQDAMWNANETAILTTSRLGSVQIWGLNAEVPESVLFADGWVDGAAWNRDETAILAWSNAPLTCSEACEYVVNIWTDVDDSAIEPSSVFPHSAFIYGAKWNNDASQILTAAADGMVRIWSVEDEVVLGEFAHDGPVLGANWNEDETQVLSWSMDGTARVWDIASGDELTRFEHDGWVEGATWNTEQDRLLTWGRDSMAKIWRAEGDLEHELSHDDWVTSAEWSVDGRQILTSSMDGSIRVWDAQSGDEEWRMDVFGLVQGTVWNNEETQILTWALTSEGHVVMIWDVEDERLLATLTHDGVIRGARWNADDNRVLTWSDDGTVRMWVVPSGDDCLITPAPAITVRQRSEPSTDGEIMGRLIEGDSTVAVGQTVGADGFVWYQLIDETWVRSDVVEATGMCDGLRQIAP